MEVDENGGDYNYYEQQEPDDDHEYNYEDEQNDNEEWQQHQGDKDVERKDAADKGGEQTQSSTAVGNNPFLQAVEGCAESDDVMGRVEALLGVKLGDVVGSADGKDGDQHEESIKG